MLPGAVTQERDGARLAEKNRNCNFTNNGRLHGYGRYSAMPLCEAGAGAAAGAATVPRQPLHDFGYKHLDSFLLPHGLILFTSQVAQVLPFCRYHRAV